MNIRFALLLPLAAAPWILPAPAREELSFHVASGTQLSRTFESHQEISLDDSEILLNGQPFPSGDEGGMTALQGMKLEVTDDFARVEDGRPRTLRRAFDKIESRGEQTTKNPMGAGERNDTRHAKSELAGKTVVFEWDETKGKFALRFDPEGPDESLLAGLAEDLDFRALLPSRGKASVDDTWNLDVGVVQTLFVPGGDLGLRPVDADDEGDAADTGSGLLGESPTEAFAGLTGTVKAVFKGTREVDDATCAVIVVELEVSANRELPGKTSGESGEIHVERVNAFLSLEGEGELLWDIAAGHARSFHLSAKIKNQLEIPMKVENGDKFLDITRKMRMSGSYDLTVAVTKR